VPAGKATQRRLVAPSDQSGALTSYSTSPGAGVSVAVFANSPVPERFAGNGAGGVVLNCSL